jgi:hypothetical protein
MTEFKECGRAQGRERFTPRYANPNPASTPAAAPPINPA